MTTTHQHQFEEIERYLHHRHPYLLVDRIVDVSSNQIVTEKDFDGQEFFAKGHFPGAQIFPGAMMQELSTQSAGVLIAARHNPMQEFDTRDPYFNEWALGVLVRVDRAKFSGFARPGDTLRATVKLEDSLGQLFDFSSRITVSGATIMRMSFRLSNIKSALLQGQNGSDSAG